MRTDNLQETIKLRNMIRRILNWLHSNMEFRIREEKRGNYAMYYPQVKGGLLGSLGVWRYFRLSEYNNNRYTIWAKSSIIKECPYRSEFKDYAEKSIDGFITTLIPFGMPRYEKKRITYKYRSVGSDGTVRYI